MYNVIRTQNCAARLCVVLVNIAFLIAQMMELEMTGVYVKICSVERGFFFSDNLYLELPKERLLILRWRLSFIACYIIDFVSVRSGMNIFELIQFGNCATFYGNGRENEWGIKTLSLPWVVTRDNTQHIRSSGSTKDRPKKCQSVHLRCMAHDVGLYAGAVYQLLSDKLFSNSFIFRFGKEEMLRGIPEDVCLFGEKEKKMAPSNRFDSSCSFQVEC